MTLHGTHVQNDIADRQPGANRIGGRPRIDECREQHVAGDTADAVQVQRRSHLAASTIRAAPHAAPNPLSMLVTTTP